jgi:hypothetical protein
LQQILLLIILLLLVAVVGVLMDQAAVEPVVLELVLVFQ